MTSLQLPLEGVEPGDENKPTPRLTDGRSSSCKTLWVEEV